MSETSKNRILVTCPTFCTSRIVSVAQSTDKLTRHRRRRGCGNVGSAQRFPHFHVPSFCLLP
jgi:hypothetical protein